MKHFPMWALIVILIIATPFSGCVGNAGENRETIAISGAFALYPMMIVWTEEYKKINPDVDFDISAGGAGKGMTDALSSMVDIGMVSRDIYPQEEEKGAVWVAVSRDAVVATMNRDNPAAEMVRERGLNRSLLKQMYIDGEYEYWDEVYPVPQVQLNLYTRSDASGAAAIWAKYLGYSQEDLLGTGVSGDPGIAEAVKADRYGIGYNNINFAYDFTTGLPLEGIQVIPLDLNDNGVVDPEEDFYKTRDDLILAISQGRYPSPPVRDLNLVARDGFEGATRDFVEWILTDGQQYNLENGYLPLSEDRLLVEKKKLDGGL